MTNPLSHLTAALLATVLAGGSSALAQQGPAPQSFSDLSRPTADMSEAGGCACFVTKGETVS
jgi:hypothetical protein